MHRVQFVQPVCERVYYSVAAHRWLPCSSVFWFLSFVPPFFNERSYQLSQARRWKCAGGVNKPQSTSLRDRGMTSKQRCRTTECSALRSFETSFPGAGIHQWRDLEVRRTGFSNCHAAASIRHKSDGMGNWGTPAQNDSLKRPWRDISLHCIAEYWWSFSWNRVGNVECRNSPLFPSTPGMWWMLPLELPFFWHSQGLLVPFPCLGGAFPCSAVVQSDVAIVRALTMSGRHRYRVKHKFIDPYC